MRFSSVASHHALHPSLRTLAAGGTGGGSTAEWDPVAQTKPKWNPVVTAFHLM